MIYSKSLPLQPLLVQPPVAYVIHFHVFPPSLSYCSKWNFMCNFSVKNSVSAVFVVSLKHVACPSQCNLLDLIILKI
jgi:hypothetical protein